MVNSLDDRSDEKLLKRNDNNIAANGRKEKEWLFKRQRRTERRRSVYRIII